MCIGVSAVRSVQKFNSALGILSKVDFRGNAPRSLAKNFSRSRSYLVSIKYDLNSYNSRAPDLVSYDGFFRRTRAPYYTPARCASYPLAKKHFISIAYNISSPFGWGHSDEFTFFKYKKVKRGLLIFARSYGFANFVSFRRLQRKFTHATRHYHRTHKKNFSATRTILKRLRPFVNALRFKTWFSSLRVGLLRFSRFSQYLKTQKFFFSTFRRSKIFSRAHSRVAKKFFFRKELANIKAAACRSHRSHLRTSSYLSFSSSVRLHLLRAVYDRSFCSARFFPEFQKRSRFLLSSFIARRSNRLSRKKVSSAEARTYSLFSYAGTTTFSSPERKFFYKFYGFRRLFFVSCYNNFYANWSKFYKFGPTLALSAPALKFFPFFYKLFYLKRFNGPYSQKNRRNRKNFRFYCKLRLYVKFLFKRGFRGLFSATRRLKKAFNCAAIVHYFSRSLKARIIVPAFWSLNSRFAGVRTPAPYFFNFRLYIPHYVPTAAGRFGLSSHQRYNTILFK
jgi:hypothetical protein